MGNRIPLSNGRRLVDDVIHIAKKMPMAAFSADWDVIKVAKLRRLTRPKIGWNVLMMKAHAIVCQQMPELRRCYVRFPWPHLYQHDQNVCMMTIGREHHDEERLFFARFNEPENRTLVELQQLYDNYRKAPIEEIKQFRHQITFAKLPEPVRRFGWWALFNLWPQKRASHMGTFGMSISQYKGARVNGHLGFNTTILGTDPTPRRGIAHAVLTFDHQILDGVPAATVLHQIHQTLTTTVAKELADMAGVDRHTLAPLSAEEIEQVKLDFAAQEQFDSLLYHWSSLEAKKTQVGDLG